MLCRLRGNVSSLRSNNELSGNGRIQFLVFYVCQSCLRPSVRGILAFEANIICSSPTIKDLQGDLARDLRLTENLDNGLHAFDDLSLHYCYKGDPGQLKDITAKSSITE